MVSAVLVMHTSCASTTTFDLDDALREVVIDRPQEPTTTHGSGSKPEFEPLSCVFRILPEIPVLQNEGLLDADSSYVQARLADTDDAFADSHLWLEALSYQPARYETISHQRLNPCGNDNLIVLDNLSPSAEGPNFLLTIESCAVDDVDNLHVKVQSDGVDPDQRLLPVQAIPSNFAFTLNELISFDAFMSPSQLEISGFAELNVTFDFTVAHLIVRERRALSRKQSVVLMDQTRAKNEEYEEVQTPDSNTSFHMEPNISITNPSECHCECTHEPSEFPLLFLKTVVEKEASDFQNIMMIQAGIGIFISIMFIWIGTRIFRSERRARGAPKSIYMMPDTTNSVQGANQSYQDGGSKNRCEPTHLKQTCHADGLAFHCDSSDIVPALVDQSPCDDGRHETQLRTEHIPSTTTPLRKCAARPHFVRMYAQFDDSIPEDDEPGCVNLNDEDSRYDTPGNVDQTPSDSPLSSPDCNEKPCSKWASRWLQNSIPEDDEPGCVNLNDEDSRKITPRKADQTPNDSPLSSPDCNETPCSKWASRWLQNQNLRQKNRRHKREAKRHQGRPMFITPVANAGGHSTAVVPIEGIDSDQRNDEFNQKERTESDFPGIAVDKSSSTPVTGNSCIPDYWGL